MLLVRRIQISSTSEKRTFDCPKRTFIETQISDDPLKSDDVVTDFEIANKFTFNRNHSPTQYLNQRDVHITKHSNPRLTIFHRSEPVRQRATSNLCDCANFSLKLVNRQTKERAVR
jgi:hypothetical protein